MFVCVMFVCVMFMFVCVWLCGCVAVCCRWRLLVYLWLCGCVRLCWVFVGRVESVQCRLVVEWRAFHRPNIINTKQPTFCVVTLAVSSLVVRNGRHALTHYPAFLTSCSASCNERVHIRGQLPPRW
jgi:hypothetical protein